MLDVLHTLIGSDADNIAWWQMVVRAALVFFYTLILVRLANRRIFGKNTSFDIVLAVILGSIMSRALTGNAPFLATMAAATALVLLHWLLASIALRSRRVGWLVKGREVPLIENGEVLEDGLRRSNMGKNDLLEGLRRNGGVESPSQVHAAYLERDGEVSVITAPPP